MSPVTGLARDEFCCLHVHMGNFSPVDRDENQNGRHKLVSFSAVVALCILVTLLLIQLICILLCHFDRHVAKLFGLKSFVPVTGLESSYGRIFIPFTEISVTGPTWLLTDEHIDIFKKERVARRDLGNRANPVDRVSPPLFPD